MNYYFDRDVACKLSVDAAIILKTIEFWIEKNKSHGLNLHDGYYWTYITYEGLQKYFPFWTVKQIRRIIKDLLDKNVILKSNFNKKNYDQTSWYTIATKPATPAVKTKCSVNGCRNKATSAIKHHGKYVNVCKKCFANREELIYS